MAIKIFCLILNYQSPTDTVAAATSLRASDAPANTQIVIIDNGPKNRAQYFRSRVPGCVYLKSPGNIGFAAGNNQGIKYALSRGASHILIINPDVVVPKTFFKPLLSSFRQHPRSGLVAPAHQEPGSNSYGLGGWVNWTYCSFPHDNVSKLPTRDRAYDLLTFACVLIKSDVFNKVGLMDERYFLYLEDVDYCVSAKKAGYSLYLNPSVCVTHRTSSSFSDPRGKIRFSYNSSFIFIRKWYRFPYNLLPLLHTITFYPYTYLLWTLKMYKSRLKTYVKQTTI